MKNGFSLFEMLLVLSLMALLGTFVIPNIKKIQNKSYAMASEVNLRTFQSSVENYYLENNAYPVGNFGAEDLFKVLKEGEFLNSSPSNPYNKKAYANSDTKGKITYVSSSGDDYSLTLYDSAGQVVQLALNKL